MEYRDYYRTLGVPRTASQGEIKKAFRKLARVHHPDVKPGDTAAEQRFKDLNEANAVLGDPEKRKQYDALGPEWESHSRAAREGGRAPAGAGGYAGFGGGGNVRYEFRTSGDGGDLGDFSDFFRMVFGNTDPDAGLRRGGARVAGTAPRGLDDILSGMSFDGDPAPGARFRPGGRSAAPPRPPVAEAVAELDLEEAFHGTSRIVEIGGKRLEVTIPPGVDAGSRIRLTGKGPNGGDLVVVCRVRPHRTFTRRGADLELELPLSLEAALLGADVPVQTLKGRVMLTVPPGTQQGRTFRLTGQGMPRFQGTGRGDLYVRTRVVLPTALSDEATKAARRLFELVDKPDPR